MNTRRPRQLRAALAAASIAGVLAGCGTHEKAPVDAAPVAVRTAAVAVVPVTSAVEAVGSLHSTQEAM